MQTNMTLYMNSINVYFADGTKTAYGTCYFGVIVPTCETDGECPSQYFCEQEKCIKRCTSNEECSPQLVCSLGMCTSTCQVR